MPIDVYNRNQDDPNFISGEIEIWSDLDIFLQEVEMILGTRRTEVLGSPKFGASLEEFIHTFDLNERELKTRITEQINTFVPLSSQIPYTVDVQFYNGSVRDIGVIDIVVDGRPVLGFVVK